MDAPKVINFVEKKNVLEKDMTGGGGLTLIMGAICLILSKICFNFVESNSLVGVAYKNSEKMTAK